MNEDEIKILADKGFFLNCPLRGKIEETHISWVLLTGTFAYKIKKPIRLGFLDFRQLERRPLDARPVDLAADALDQRLVAAAEPAPAPRAHAPHPPLGPVLGAARRGAPLRGRDVRLARAARRARQDLERAEG